MKSKRYMRKYIFLSLIALNFIFTAQAKSWHASYFGIRSDGMTDNTASFQKALDWISTFHPGDTLDIRVGRYLTAPLQLRSNITIHMGEGALFVPIEDYIFSAENVKNVELCGKGVDDNFQASKYLKIKNGCYNIIVSGKDVAAPLYDPANRICEYVDPFIGTDKMGHTFPGACVPHGIVALSPDTDTVPHNINGIYQPRAYEYCAGYQYADATIVGFSHTHFSGTGHSDLGDVMIMPAMGAHKLFPGTADNPDGGYRSRFRHETETARPGYYAVHLDDHNIDVQLTATERVGVHRYIFPKSDMASNIVADNPHIILDLNHAIYNYDGKVLWANVRVENDTLITGYRITNGWARTNYTYFAISLSKPISNYGYVDLKKPDYLGHLGKFDVYHNFPDICGRKIVCYFDFDHIDTLEIRVALSAVSSEGALKNLNAEAPQSRSFNDLVQRAEGKWQHELSVIQADGDKKHLTMLYTSLYHTLINPSVYMDVDGRYRGLDQHIHQAEGFTNYTIFSLWDTYRALMPLYNIINRDRSKDMAASMLAHYDQSVHHILPVWSHMGNENFCMIGYHGVSVLANDIVTGIELNQGKAYEAMLNSSRLTYYGGLDQYMKLGYVPMESATTAASNTLEYAYDDWTISQIARLRGDRKTEQEYLKRSQNFRNIFDPTSGLACGKNANGSWLTPFEPLSTVNQGFIEGNSWNYSFYVPQDVPALMECMGGEKRFVERLDSLFTMYLPDSYFAETEDVTREGIMGNYVHGNEVSHHIPYLYMWTKEPWKTQYWLREIMNRMYRPERDGLCGNDDCGQMSAWYVFTAMGFYPVCPASGQYIIGAPYFPYMKVDLGNGNTLTIKAPKASDKNRYVKSVTLNGKPVGTIYLTHEQIMAGGELVFEMTSVPGPRSH